MTEPAPDSNSPQLTFFEQAFVVRVLQAMKQSFATGREAAVNAHQLNQIREELHALPPEKLSAIAQDYKPGQEKVIFGEEPVE